MSLGDNLKKLYRKIGPVVEMNQRTGKFRIVKKGLFFNNATQTTLCFKNRKILKENKGEIADRIENLLCGAEEFIHLNSAQGFKLLNKASQLYDEKIGYKFETECKINDVVLTYMRKYPPEIFFKK